MLKSYGTMVRQFYCNELAKAKLRGGRLEIEWQITPKILPLICYFHFEKFLQI